MLPHFENLLLYFLTAMNGLVVVFTGWALIRFERRWKNIEDYWDDSTTADSTTEDLTAAAPVTAAGKSDAVRSMELARAYSHIEGRLDHLQRALEQLGTKSAPQDPVIHRHVPIENAVSMARQGASIDELKRNCGLSLGEARLISKLHGQTRPALN